MKLTKEKLKQIIREEVKKLGEGFETPYIASQLEDDPGHEEAPPTGKSYQIEGPEGDIVVHGDSHKFIDDYLGRVNLSKIIKEWMNMELRK